MKKILLLFILAVWISACGPHIYNAYSGGKDNSSFIIVLTNAQPYDSVSVIVDGKPFQIEKVYKVKDTMKAHPIKTEPGKHHIKVVTRSKSLFEEDVVIGLQETKKIILE